MSNGPFSVTQSQFYKGQVIPVVARGFRDPNKDFNKIISMLAREASLGDHGMIMFPLVYTDIKGGALPLMLQQFKQAIGIAIA